MTGPRPAAALAASLGAAALWPTPGQWLSIEAALRDKSERAWKAARGRRYAGPEYAGSRAALREQARADLVLANQIHDYHLCEKP